MGGYWVGVQEGEEKGVPGSHGPCPHGACSFSAGGYTQVMVHLHLLLHNKTCEGSWPPTVHKDPTFPQPFMPPGLFQPQ